MTEIVHRTILTNGIRMHIAEQGQGPAGAFVSRFSGTVVFLASSIGALAQAGFHAVAPDMRGYGQTDRPDEIEKYSLLHLVGDMVGVLDAMGEPTAVIAGHDWGAPVAWHAGLMRPDRFRAVIGLSVPFRPRGAVPPTTIMPKTDDAIFSSALFSGAGCGRGGARERRAAEPLQNPLLSVRRCAEAWRKRRSRRADCDGATARRLPGAHAGADSTSFLAKRR